MVGEALAVLLEEVEGQRVAATVALRVGDVEAQGVPVIVALSMGDVEAQGAPDAVAHSVAEALRALADALLQLQLLPLGLALTDPELLWLLLASGELDSVRLPVALPERLVALALLEAEGALLAAAEAVPAAQVMLSLGVRERDLVGAPLPVPVGHCQLPRPVWLLHCLAEGLAALLLLAVAQGVGEGVRQAVGAPLALLRWLALPCAEALPVAQREGLGERQAEGVGEGAPPLALPAQLLLPTGLPDSAGLALVRGEALPVAQGEAVALPVPLPAPVALPRPWPGLGLPAGLPLLCVAAGLLLALPAGLLLGVPAALGEALALPAPAPELGEGSAVAAGVKLAGAEAVAQPLPRREALPAPERLLQRLGGGLLLPWALPLGGAVAVRAPVPLPLTLLPGLLLLLPLLPGLLLLLPLPSGLLLPQPLPPGLPLELGTLLAAALPLPLELASQDSECSGLAVAAGRALLLGASDGCKDAVGPALLAAVPVPLLAEQLLVLLPVGLLLLLCALLAVGSAAVPLPWPEPVAEAGAEAEGAALLGVGTAERDPPQREGDVQTVVVGERREQGVALPVVAVGTGCGDSKAEAVRVCRLLLLLEAAGDAAALLEGHWLLAGAGVVLGPRVAAAEGVGHCATVCMGSWLTVVALGAETAPTLLLTGSTGTGAWGGSPRASPSPSTSTSSIPKSSGASCCHLGCPGRGGPTRAEAGGTSTGVRGGLPAKV